MSASHHQLTRVSAEEKIDMAGKKKQLAVHSARARQPGQSRGVLMHTGCVTTASKIRCQLTQDVAAQKQTLYALCVSN